MCNVSKFLRGRGLYLIGAVVAFVLLMCATNTASCQAFASYNVRHFFYLLPAGASTANVYDVHSVGGGGTEVSSSPLPFVASFFGYDTPIPPSGGVGSGQSNSSSASATAHAHAMGTVNAYAPPGAIAAATQADGFASVSALHGFAAASSGASITARAGNILQNGQISWTPGIFSIIDTASGFAVAHGIDPIDFNVLDKTTGNSLTGNMLSITSDLTGTGSFAWDSINFTLDAQDFLFKIDISSPFTVQQGAVDFQVANGIVTKSDTSGIFAGLFPAVGSSGNFSMPFGPILLDYDFGIPPGDELDIAFDLGGSGIATVSSPEGSSLALLGIGTLPLLLCIHRSRNKSRRGK